ncbi:hypothetical protein ACSBR1_030311 [Camellia fascicularis]
MMLYLHQWSNDSNPTDMQSDLMAIVKNQRQGVKPIFGHHITHYVVKNFTVLVMVLHVTPMTGLPFKEDRNLKLRSIVDTALSEPSLQRGTQKHFLHHIKPFQNVNFHYIQMASPLPDLDFPHFPFPPPPAVKPPPPPRTIPPPPPHIIPPPPPSSPDHGGSTVIIIISVSCGGLLLLAFLAIALFCIIIKKKKKKKEKVQETDIVHVHEHLKVKEAVVKGPRGTEVVTLAIDDDVHVDEEIRKEEKFKGTHAKLKSADDNPSAIEEGVSTSHSSQHHLGAKP